MPLSGSIFTEIGNMFAFFGDVPKRSPRKINYGGCLPGAVMSAAARSGMQDG